jgi:predicted PhzF superfamily epimerase YddE/YHI9
MPTRRYHIVDVFSAEAYKGNPLAVVENSSDSLNTTQMQLIARQFNLS